MEFDADIFDAVEFGNLADVQTYWTDSININYQDLSGIDLLMLACKYGHLDIVKYLLQFNPDLENKNNKGQTAIDIAIKNNFMEIVAQLKLTTTQK